MNQIYMADMAVKTGRRPTGVLKEESISLGAEQQQAVVGLKRKAQETWKDALDKESGNVTGESFLHHKLSRKLLSSARQPSSVFSSMANLSKQCIMERRFQKACYRGGILIPIELLRATLGCGKSAEEHWRIIPTRI